MTDDAFTIFATYLAVSGAAVMAWRLDRRRIWLMIAGVLLTMGIARTTGLSDISTSWVRAWWRDAGWYEGRKPFQIATLLVAAMGVGGMIFAIARRGGTVHVRRARLAAIGVLTVSAIALIQLVSLHDAVVWMTRTTFGLPRWRLVEAIGLVLVVAGSFDAVHAIANRRRLRERFPLRRPPKTRERAEQAELGATTVGVIASVLRGDDRPVWWDGSDGPGPRPVPLDSEGETSAKQDVHPPHRTQELSPTDSTQTPTQVTAPAQPQLARQSTER